MDGTGKHYAKGNKPGGERQIPYDLTFNRNLMNKQTSKQNITKDTEIEKRPTVTTPKGRGEGISGGKGEGFVGTIIKDTWTKPKGVGSNVGGGGGSGSGAMVG